MASSDQGPAEAARDEAASQPPPTPLSLILLSRSPPRPSPGSLHYSDEDVTKYNDLIQAESSSLTEKPSEVSDSQVRGPGRVEQPLPRTGLYRGPSGVGGAGPPSSSPLWAMATQGPQQTMYKSGTGQLPPPRLCSEFAPGAHGVPGTVSREDTPRPWSSHSQEAPQAQPLGGSGLSRPLKARRGRLAQQLVWPGPRKLIHGASQGQNEPQKWKAGCPGAPWLGGSRDWGVIKALEFRPELESWLCRR